jgi:tetratricopeptide (TPR) repeat protein
MELYYNADLKTIGNSLMVTLSEIEKNGETPILKAEMLYKYARVKFCDGKFIEAHQVFGQCNSHLIMNNLPENKEIYYWVGRILEEKGEFEKAKTTYTISLERARFLNDQIFVDEILDRIHKIVMQKSE